jgi:hypothetical protein
VVVVAVVKGSQHDMLASRCRSSRVLIGLARILGKVAPRTVPCVEIGGGGGCLR